MRKIQNDFAAIAVMGELYNSGKDIYDVLAAYLQVVIQSEKLNGFTCAEITNRINKMNSFSISDAVVKTALKRLGLVRKSGVYTVDDSFNSKIDTTSLEELTSQNKIVIDRLFDFISLETGNKLSEEDKSNIENQFYRYISDPDCDESYSILISKFLMENSKDAFFNTSLNRIKEGLLVYEGICFSPEIGFAGKWVIPLDIYLEQEVLFYIAGYNGEIHKDIYGQLIEYTDEINASVSANSSKIINLYYTDDVKTEIESYFSTAETIFEKNEVVDPSKTAMVKILEGVNSKRDIQIKKVDFYNLLARKGITQKETNFYSAENLQYNIIDASVYQYICDNVDSERGEEYVKRCSEKINQINIIRRNRNNSLKEAKAILLTANATILRCAYLPFAFKEGDTPKAVNLDYVITRLWYKLGKGFGKGDSPKSVDIISRAQMIISSMTMSKVSKSYEEIKQKYNEGSIAEDEVAQILVELRKVSKNPEDITIESIDEQIRFLTDYGINSRLEKLKKEEIARQKDKDTIKELQFKLIEAENIRIKENEKRDAIEKKLEKRISDLENSNVEVLHENQKLAATIQKQIDLRKKWKLNALRVGRGVVFVLGLLVITALIFVICRCIFNIDKSISGIVSILLTLVFQFFTPLKGLWKKFVVDYSPHK